MDFDLVYTKYDLVSWEDSTNSSLIIKPASCIMVALYKIKFDFFFIYFLNYPLDKQSCFRRIILTLW